MKFMEQEPAKVSIANCYIILRSMRRSLQIKVNSNEARSDGALRAKLVAIDNALSRAEEIMNEILKATH